MVVHFFSTFFLVLVQVRPLRLVKRAQCEATEKKVLRSSILWQFIEDLINQINHHVTPVSEDGVLSSVSAFRPNNTGVFGHSNVTFLKTGPLKEESCMRRP